MMIDNYGRHMNYLRISITDRCNLRCSYCMPCENVKFLPKNEILSYDELLRICKVFYSLGVKKLRFTGGEPFVRKDFIKLLQQIRLFADDLNIHLTTNATLLSPYVSILKDLNIKNINISLDTLREDRFYEITRRNELRNVLSAINECIDNGFNLKVNMVVQDDVNLDEVKSMVEYFKSKPIELRFIEYMPFNEQDIFKNHLDGRFLFDELKQYYPYITELERPENSTSSLYKINDTNFKIGIIEGYSRSFCESCNRIRLTSTGLLKTCLYADPSSDLKSLMRNGSTDEELKKHIFNIVTHRYKNGFEAESQRSEKLLESMSKIGG